MATKREPATPRDYDKLYRAIVACQNVDEARKFLDDLLTPQEKIDLCDRVTVADLFLKDKTYVDSKTGIAYCAAPPRPTPHSHHRFFCYPSKSQQMPAEG